MPPKRKRTAYMRRYMSARRVLLAGGKSEAQNRNGCQEVTTSSSCSDTDGGIAGSTSSSSTRVSDQSDHVHQSSSSSSSEYEDDSSSDGSSAKGDTLGSSQSGEPVNLSDQLRDWMVSYQVKQDAGDALLKILNDSHPELPSSMRTILDTPRSARTYADMQEMSGGETAYLGLKSQLDRVMDLTTPEQRDQVDELHLSVNIDGMSPFKSSKSNFWPVLCCLMNLLNWVVFPITIFFGNNHPTNLDFLTSFIDELATLSAAGLYYGGKKFTVVLKAVICDAPARALSKGILQCGSYFGCDKCIQQGKYLKEKNERGGRVMYPDIASELRTDISFRRQLQRQHHKVESPFCRLKIDMISAFPIDGMHQVFEGVIKNLLFIWVKGSKTVKKSLKGAHLEAVNLALASFRSSVPSFFARKPRSLKELGFWKGTEFRQFLLYTGPVVLKNYLRRELYDHFMLLHVAISILVDPLLCTPHHDYAQRLLELHVERSKLLYGNSHVTYNVHSLIHIAADAVHFGSLDACSAWMFEDYLFQVKRMVRSGFRPLEQVVCRLAERNNGVWLRKVKKNGIMYNPPDNAFVLDDGRCCQVMQPVPKCSRAETKEVQCAVYDVCDLYTTPCRSSLLGSFKTCAPAYMAMIECTKLRHPAICTAADDGGVIFLRLRHRIL